MCFQYSETYSDICYAEYEDKHLMIIAEYDKLYATNILTSTVEWTVTGKLPGKQEKMSATRIITDGCSHLYVCDYRKDNRSIQMFSVSEGFYLGCYMREGEQNIGAPILTFWSQVLRFLLVVHKKNDQWYLGSISSDLKKY